MGFLENPNASAYNQNPFVSTAFATATTSAVPNYSTLYPFVKGDTLGIIVANNTGSTDNTPLQLLQ